MSDFRKEFPDFPEANLPAIPSTWTDQSWRNDACPSFDAGNGVAVFVDYADIEKREMPEGPRFTVMGTDHTDTLLDTDDWNEVLAYVAGVKAVSS